MCRDVDWREGLTVFGVGIGGLICNYEPGLIWNYEPHWF